MTAKKILLTGITGFIGSHVAQKLISKKYDVEALVRPTTDKKKLIVWQDKINFIKVDLANTKALKKVLQENTYNAILHIGALRGGRKATKKEFYKTNVDATEQLVLHALEHHEKFIFCSSVGVFGAIPKELPATNSSPKQNDNFYHYTKNICEDIIQKYVLQGLDAVILRPSITYGKGDFGFPYTLIKLIDKKMFFLPTTPVLIHLTNIELLQEAFKKAIDEDIVSGSEFIIADKEPVRLDELSNLISSEIHKKKLSSYRYFPERFFQYGENIARKWKSETWTARFELISKDWYYNIEQSNKIFGLKNCHTLHHFRDVIEWYRGL